MSETFDTIANVRIFWFSFRVLARRLLRFLDCNPFNILGSQDVKHKQAQQQNGCMLVPNKGLWCFSANKFRKSYQK